MNIHFKFGMTHATAFATTSESHAVRFDRAVKRRIPSTRERDLFFRLVYLDWMAIRAIHPNLPSEARWPILVAQQKLVASAPSLDRSPDLIALRQEMERGLDETVALFGLDPENARYAALKSSDGAFSFSSLISQIVLSELVPDETLHLTNPSHWRRHWRGGRL